jgi:RND family efflux transporter MFP subunit
VKLSIRSLAPLLVVVAGLVGAVLLVATGPDVASTAPAPLVPLVRVVDAEPQRFQHRVMTHGTVQPRTESELVPEVSGRVEWLAPSFASGGFFRKGETLLRIEAGDYRTDLKRARSSLARADSELARATLELDRQKELAQNDIASASRLDDAQNAEKVARAALGEARANLEQAERDLQRTELSAAFDGRVRSESVDVGQFVSRGVSIATVYAVDAAEVRLPVPDAELAFLDLPQLYQADEVDAPGPEVLLHVEFAGTLHTWEGRVVRTEGEIDPRTRMVHVVARIEKPYARQESGRPPLAAGLFVEAEILGRVDTAVFVLPRAALREGNRTLIVDAEGRLHWRDVQVARANRREVVITRGLEPGDRVCISVLESVVEGMSVRVRGDAT